MIKRVYVITFSTSVVFNTISGTEFGTLFMYTQNGVIL